LLSKRASDIIMIAIIAVIALVVVVVRFQVLGVFDDRIEEAEQRNASLESEIAEKTRVLDTYYRDEVLPGWSTLSRSVPAVFTEESLLSYVHGHLETIGLNRRDEEQELHVVITEAPSFPSGTQYNALAQQLDAYRIRINFKTTDIDEAHQVVDYFHDLDHLFVLMEVDFRVPDDTEEKTDINLYFVTFYQSP